MLLDDLADSVSHFASIAAAKLRSQKSTARMLQVFIMTDRFREDRAQYNPSVAISMAQATADTMTIAGYASMGLRQIFKDGYQYKKAGVILGDIGPEHIVQADLFADEAPVTSSCLMSTLDAINAKYGRGSLKLGNDGSSKAWAMRTENKSPSYTTIWEEMPRCK